MKNIEQMLKAAADMQKIAQDSDSLGKLVYWEQELDEAALELITAAGNPPSSNYTLPPIIDDEK